MLLLIFFVCGQDRDNKCEYLYIIHKEILSKENFAKDEGWGVEITEYQDLTGSNRSIGGKNNAGSTHKCQASTGVFHKIPGNTLKEWTLLEKKKCVDLLKRN